MWKKLSSRTILDHPRLKVIEDEVLLPNGIKTDYLKFEQKGNTPTIIVLNKEKKILVIKEYFYVINKWLYLFPGGFVPESEDIKEGIARELKEETGVKTKKLTSIGTFYSNIRRSAVRVDVFLGQSDEESAPNPDEEELIKVYWFTEKEIDQLIEENNFIISPSLAAWAIYKIKKPVV